MSSLNRTQMVQMGSWIQQFELQPLKFDVNSCFDVYIIDNLGLFCYFLMVIELILQVERQLATNEC